MGYPSAYRPTRTKTPKSSEHINRKSKTWVSDGSVKNDREDLSPRSGMPWWKSPMMKAERLRRAETRR